MKEYPKIETIFNRGTDGSKKLIIGDWRNPTVDMLQNIPWVFTEKIDGMNIRVHWDGHKMTFAGRTDRAQIPGDLASFLAYKFGGPVNEELFEQLFGDREATLFGEGYGPGIQNGGAYRDDKSFILFDVSVVDQQTGETIWLDRDKVISIGETFNAAIVPVILSGSLMKAVDYVRTKPQSTIGTAPMEGVVGRPAIELKDRHGARIIVKIKARDFDPTTKIEDDAVRNELTRAKKDCLIRMGSYVIKGHATTPKGVHE